MVGFEREREEGEEKEEKKKGGRRREGHDVVVRPSRLKKTEQKKYGTFNIWDFLKLKL